MSHTKIRALQQWCKALVDGYKDVNITNMTSSWRDGLAFCALIHRFRPDLINFDALSKNNVFDNNQLAFTVAESIGVPALLEAKDMYDLPVPDKLSVITYVASMHNYFKDKEKLGGPDVSSYKGGNIQIGTKRHQDNDPLNTTEPKRSTPDQSEEKTKKIGSTPTRQRSPADDLCTLCQGKVYLIEKQIDNGKLYHRSCFRSSYMSPTSKILSRSLSNGAANDVSVPGIHAKVEPTASIAEKSKSPTKVRLFEKRKEQIQKAEEKLKAERGNEVYERRQNTPSALRNHLKNMDSQGTENSKSSSDSPASRSSQPRAFSKPSSPERENTPEQPSWAQTKLRKVFDDPASSSPTALSLCAEKKQSSKSPPSSPVLMMQVTSRTMQDKQYRASKTVTKSSTNLEAEAGKTQLVSGLLKSLANIRQRQSSTSSTSPTSPLPQSSSGVPPFFKVSAAPKPTSPVPTAISSLPFSQPSNSLSSNPAQPVLTSGPLQAKTRDGNILIQTKHEAFVTQKEQPRSVARIKSVIKSTPTNPATPEMTQPLKVVPVSTASALSAKSKVTNESFPPPDSITKPKAYTNTTETPPPQLFSSAKSNIISESSPSRSASPAKSNISKIASESTPSRSASPAKSHVSKIASESSPSRSASPAKVNVSRIASESTPSRSASPAKSNVSKITSERSPSKSASPARSNLSRLNTPPLQNDSPSRSALSKTPVGTSSIITPATDKLNAVKDNKPQSILERIEQYSKVAAGVDKPPAEQSPKREILLENNDHDKQGDGQSTPKPNAFTTTSTTITSIAVKKPLASESIKERNTVSRHIASPTAPKKMDDKSETVCLPPPVVKTYKNGQTAIKAEITKDIKLPTLAPNLTSKTQPDTISAATAAYSPKPKRLPHVKAVDKNSTPVTNAASTPAAFSVGLTKLHPAHYNPKSSDSSPKSTFVPSNTATVQSLNMKVNPIPKPRRQKTSLTPSTTKENKENPIENKVSYSNGANSNKTTGALSERQDTGETGAKTEWQLEAERRIALRRGKYVDPETHLTRFVLPDSSAQLDNEKNGDDNQKTRHADLNSNATPDFAFRKHLMPKQDLDSLEWSNPKKRLSTDEIQKELMDIDSKLTDLELRGRQLEVSIRADVIEFSAELPCDSTDSVLPLSKCNMDSSEDEENFMVEWFQLINEKNELVRRENDLIYQSQELELEEEQIRIDKELQALMIKPYEKKSKSEKKKEKELIQQKIDVVNQRNLIVDSIDEDRLRYKEEDEGIKEVLQSKGYL